MDFCPKSSFSRAKHAIGRSQEQSISAQMLSEESCVVVAEKLSFRRTSCFHPCWWCRMLILRDVLCRGSVRSVGASKCSPRRLEQKLPRPILHHEPERNPGAGNTGSHEVAQGISVRFVRQSTWRLPGRQLPLRRHEVWSLNV